MDRPLIDRIREVGEEVKSWPVWMRRLMGQDQRVIERRVDRKIRRMSDKSKYGQQYLSADIAWLECRRKRERRGK